jgi:hypothetical protein
VVPKGDGIEVIFEADTSAQKKGTAEQEPEKYSF